MSSGSYTVRFFKMIKPSKFGTDHEELGMYEYSAAPWIPRQGEFFRFHDHSPPGRPVDHTQYAGTVEKVVTVFYGGSTPHAVIEIEVYIRPRTSKIRAEDRSG